MTNPITGIGYLFRGLGLIMKPGIKRYVLIPLLINILLFAGLLWFLGDQFGVLADWMMSYIPDWLSWLSWLFWALFGLTSAIIIFFTFSFVANLIGAPFNSYLAAAVEKFLTGERPPGSPNSPWKEFGVAIFSELKKWLYYLIWLIPLVIASFLLAPIAPVLWFIFGAWMYSIEYSDYPMGNQGMTFTEIRNELSTKRFMSLGFGGMVTVATMIPLVNFIVMPVAVAGATAMRVDQFPLKKVTRKE